MSSYPANEPSVGAATAATVDIVIEPQEKDLGEFTVRRVLPAPKRRMVGPFVFFDHMGPAEFPPGQGIAVRPHPHIGIATITYLFEGEIIHRDNLGYVQPIRPGAVNLMTAGRGIVHSERAGDDLDTTSRLHGIQSWIALPEDQQECEPAFVHYAATDLPAVSVGAAELRIIMGRAFGATSPVTTYSDTLYIECVLPSGAALEIPAGTPELAAYVVSGRVSIGNTEYGPGKMPVAAAGHGIGIAAIEDSRVMIIGGGSLGPRHVWWNLVSTSRERIDKAADDWVAGRFDPVPGDDEFIPLPER